MYSYNKTSSLLMKLLVFLSFAVTLQQINAKEVATSVAYSGLDNATKIELTSGMRNLRKSVQLYRQFHSGDYPNNISVLMQDMLSNTALYGYQSTGEIMNSLLPISETVNGVSPRSSRDIPYLLLGARPIGEKFNMPRKRGEKNLVSYTQQYVRFTTDVKVGDNTSLIFQGLIPLLWDDGDIQFLEQDLIFYMPTPRGFIWCFPGQAGVSSEILSFQEYWKLHTRTGGVLFEKLLNHSKNKIMALDNGGPESLVSFSRLLRAPMVTEPYVHIGIEREKLWQVFDPAQEEFTLTDIQKGSGKLGLTLAQKSLNLDELAKLNVPALLFLKDDGRIVTLGAIDDKEAMVIDRGITRLVSREVLEKRYSGNALVMDKADAARMQADDTLRVLTLPTGEKKVAQEVVIRNTGKTPLTLEVEHPIPGGESAELSADTVPAGGSATLKLSLVWRDVLKGDTQNVWVYLRTNDPARPRLPLGFQLKK